MDEKPKAGDEDLYYDVLDHIKSVLDLKNPPGEILEKLMSLGKEDYFDLLDSINKHFIKIKFPRLSALLQNLFERRKNKWQKHLSMADGPKKLKDIQDDINREEE